MMHIFVTVYLNIYVFISLYVLKLKMEYQVTDFGKSSLPIVILDIIILYDSLTDGLQNYKKW